MPGPLFKRFDELSLRLKLGAGFAALIILTLAVGGASLISHRRALATADAYFDRYERIADLSLESNAALLRARRYEKDFLLKVGQFGFDEAKSRYATLVRSHLATVRDNMAAIRALTDDAELARQAQAVAAAAGRYESGFLQVVELYGRRGQADSGLEGQYRARAHAIEALLGEGAAERLTSDLLALRRAEKDFIMRGRSRDAAAFATAAERFRQHLDGAPLAAVRRADLQRLLGDYRALFAQYVAVKAAIDAGSLAYLGEVQAIEPMLDRLYRHAEQAIDTTRDTLRELNVATTWTVAGASLAAILLGLLVSVFIGRNVGRSVRLCVDFADRLAAGELAARLQPAGGKEFGVLMAGLNHMADSLDKAHRLEDVRVAELGRLNRTLRVLSQCNYTLVRAGNEAELLEAIGRQVVDIGGYRLAWIGYAIPDEERSILPACIAGADDGYVENLCLTWGEDPQRQGMAGRAIRERRAVWVRDVRDDPIFAAWREAAARRGLRSCIALPLIVRSEVLGSLSIYAEDPDAFDAEEVKLLQELADDLAFGIAGLRQTAARERAERALDYQANYDAATGLANRNLLTDRLRQAIAHAGRAGHHVGVMLLGLDRFRAVNERLGREAGDALLKHVGRCLAACLREGDTVARLAGDEFVVVMGDATRAEDLLPVAAKLLEAVQRPLTVAGQELRASATLGISVYPRDGAAVDDLLRNAEAALSSAKSLDGNVFRFYAPEMNERVSARYALEAGLRRAIEHDELLVHYQPKVSLANGRLTSAEALVRWNRPGIGMVSPAEFIPLAEETGLIQPLGEWVLHHVCEQLRAWLDAGLEVPTVAVNLSTRQFRQKNLPQLVRQSLRVCELDPKLLDLEITESSLMDDLAGAVATLRELKEIGVGLSLDDFGTGYSSLSYLKRFPIDHLKIDRAFVRDITTDPDDAAICIAVINLAHNLKLSVVAEGVETEAQMNYLRQHGCDEMQGYYFSKPLPAEDFARLLAERRGLALPSDEGERRTLLIVDDEPSVLAALKRALHKENYRVLTAGSAAEGFDLLARNGVQVILSDQRMPEMSGTEFLSRVRELYPDTIRIVLSGYAELESVTEAINRGAIYKFLTKPWDGEQLRDHVREAFRYQASLRRQDLRSSLEA